MAAAGAEGAIDPVMAFALVGALGVGAQWLAWRLRMPAIVLMLAAGLVVGPLLGIFDPERDIGPIMDSLISVAVAIILFEGGMSLNFHSLREATTGVKRLVYVGAPIGWVLSALALRYAAGLSWESSWVFGGIMIVTGPTVIAPLLRSARMDKRPAQLLQWEAIVNDPIGALAAVLAFEVVLILQTSVGVGGVVVQILMGIGLALALGGAAGWGLSEAFRRGKVPEFMKVPVLFVSVLAVFALCNYVLHESGLLAVTVMGVWMANAHLPSYSELRRFKEHATILLVSGVFILLAADMKIETLQMLDIRAVVFVLSVVLLVRPLTVLIALIGTNIPKNERFLVGLTGPRGVVLVAVAGFFASLLKDIGIEDGASLVPLAFVLVAATVVLHGFSLAPLARYLGLAGHGTPGVIIVGGSKFSTALGKALHEAEVPVIVTDFNRAALRESSQNGLKTFTGDILSEGAEMGLAMSSYGTVLALSGNEAYNTLVATDFAPEFGRENVLQLQRSQQDKSRHALPPTLGGRSFGRGLSYADLVQKMYQGWDVRVTGVTEDFGFDEWQAHNPEGLLLAVLRADGELIFADDKTKPKSSEGTRLIWFGPKRDKEAEAIARKAEDAQKGKKGG